MGAAGVMSVRVSRACSRDVRVSAVVDGVQIAVADLGVDPGGGLAELLGGFARGEGSVLDGAEGLGVGVDGGGQGWQVRVG